MFLSCEFRYMSANNIKFPSKSTYFDNQKNLHLPVVQKMWDLKRAEAVDETKQNDAVHCGGDGR